MKDRLDSEPQVVRQTPSTPTPTPTIEHRLRVLMVAATAVHGGHVVQMEKTAEALEGMGHEVAVADATAARVTGWDIVHAFGAPWRFGTSCARHGKPARPSRSRRSCGRTDRL